jgi:hypothetical protein
MQTAEQSELGHLRKHAWFEMRFLIPFFDIRRDFAGTKFTHGLLQRQVFFG